jgi:sRNA-binding protein
MAYKPNYGLQRADRNRAAQARSEQKQRKREEKSAQRKAERTVEIKSSSDDDKAQWNDERSMNVAESKGLKKGGRVYWRGDATDGGIITEVSWDAVTITWDNGQVATVHHGDMREIQRAPAKPTIV